MSTAIQPRESLVSHQFVKPVFQQSTMMAMLKAASSNDDTESIKHVRKQVNEIRETLGHKTAPPLEALMIEQVARRFIDLQDKALSNLESILDDKGVDEAVRLRASMGVLDYALKLAKLNKDNAVIDLVTDLVGED